MLALHTEGEQERDRMTKEEIVNKQLAFFCQKRAGCLFVAPASIDARLAAAISDPEITMVSLIFPQVTSAANLVELIATLQECETVELEQREEYQEMVCFGFRAIVGDLRSYVTGFCDLPFLPATRRTPFTELTMRVKPRPDYEFQFKEAPPNVIHLADLDMRGMERDRLWQLWHNSFIQTERVLRKKPDLLSAARTTYAIPKELCSPKV
jgi:hypothetical protein